MSPTSYQAAPPREFIIADAQRAVKRIEHTCERFNVSGFARETVVYGDDTAPFDDRGAVSYCTYEVLTARSFGLTSALASLARRIASS
jgi:hypothetical protein